MLPLLEESTCPACGKIAVRWNPYNRAVTCHACGEILWLRPGERGAVERGAGFIMSRLDPDTSPAVRVVNEGAVELAAFPVDAPQVLAVLGHLIDMFDGGDGLAAELGKTLRICLAHVLDPAHAARVFDFLGGDELALMNRCRDGDTDALVFAACRLVERSIPPGYRFHVIIMPPGGDGSAGGTIEELRATSMDELRKRVVSRGGLYLVPAPEGCPHDPPHVAGVDDCEPPQEAP